MQQCNGFKRDAATLKHVVCCCYTQDKRYFLLSVRKVLKIYADPSRLLMCSVPCAP